LRPYRTACRAAPVVVPVSSTPDAADQGIPPLLTVAVGVLLILVPAAFMIVRARRNT
jgi:hypothetical protein